MSTEVRAAVAADAVEIGAVFSRAFANDPVTSWITADAARRDRLLRRLNTLIARYEGIPRGATYVALRDGSIVGASIWQPPGRPRLGWGTIPFSLGAGRALGRDMARMIAAGRAAAGARSWSDSWYLQLLGVSPDAQGDGVGSALVRAHLAVVDAERSDAGLETTAENLAFYARLGFESVRQITIAPGAPIEFALRRPAV